MTSAFELSALNGYNGFRIDGPAANDGLNGAGSAGDINGDGFADLVLGTWSINSTKGAAYVFYGSQYGFSSAEQLSSLDGSDGVTLSTGFAHGEFGFSVSALGDVNGDGFDDFVLGSPGVSGSHPYIGTAYVVFGSSTGISTNPANWISISGFHGSSSVGELVSAAGDINGDGFNDIFVDSSYYGAFVVLGSASPTSLNTFTGLNDTNSVMFSRAASAIASAGDMNGDGFGDLLIGNQSADYNGQDSGAVWIFAGSLNLTDIGNGTLIKGVVGQPIGYAVAGADVNGDGFSDAILGVPGSDANGTDSGTTYVIFGKAAAFGSTFDLATLDGTNGFRIDGEAAGDRSGGTVASAGDFNGDGITDLLIGAGGVAANGPYAGAAYVIFGSSSGFATTLQLSALDGHNGFRINGANAQDGLHGVSAAGDVNGDGYDDLIVTAAQSDPNGANSGSSYVIFGHPDAPVVLNGTNGNDTLTGFGTDDTLNGFGGNDLLIGRGGNDTLNGGGGNDTASFLDHILPVTASLAAGTAVTSTGTTTLSSIENLTGGSGDDFLTGDGHTNVLMGGDGKDKLNGGNGDDTLFGGAGNDNLIGVAGNDTIHGEDGDDTIKGGVGNDIIDGGNGIDTANFADAHGGVTASLLTNNATGGADVGSDTLIAIENLSGTTGNDTLTGDGGVNAIQGNDGVDLIDGQGGNDDLNGGAGNDTITGGDGDDIIRGAKGNDVLNGNDGNDTFSAGGPDGIGDDSLAGGNGIDTADYGADTNGITGSLLTGIFRGTATGKDTLSSVENIIGSKGDDTITGDSHDNVLAGGNGNDSLNGDAGNDMLNGGAGNDILNGGDGNDTLVGGAGTDSLNGGNGIDTVDYSAESAAVTASLATQNATGTSIGNDTFSGIENLTGGAGNDTLTGDGNANVLLGNAGQDTLIAGGGDDTVDGGAAIDSIQGQEGNDVLHGGTENDTIDGGNGADQLFGDDGNDVLIGGAGNDTLDGGNGVDIADYEADTLGIVANMNTNTVTGGAGVDVDTLANVESVMGGTGNDTFIAGSAPANFSGGGGNDTFFGGIGNDNFAGDAGIDTVDYSAITTTINVDLNLTTATGADIGTDFLYSIEVVLGGSGNDTFRGLDGNTNNVETFNGGAGNDTFYGSRGNDTLIGGAGIDTLDLSQQAAALNVFLALGFASGGLIGSDTISGIENVTTGGGGDTLVGDGNDNVLIANAGNDVVTGGGGNDTMDGGLGRDIADYSTDTAGITGSLATGIVDGTLSGHDTLINFELLSGGSGADHLTAGSGTLVLTGNNGDDVLVASATGVNMQGGNGNDTLAGGLANDVLDGGQNIDTANYSAQSAAMIINLNAGTATGSSIGSDSLVAIENAIGGTGNDTITGTTGDNVLTGNAGNDAIDGVTGNDTIDGDDGDDNLTGGDGNDTLTGGAGTDTLSGGIGNDSLTGGDGSDTMIGGAGTDFLDGGPGNDIFIFAAAADSTGPGYDTLNGFDAVGDHIDTTATVTGIDVQIKHDTLSIATFDTDLAAAVNAGTLAANHAVTFKADAGTLSGHTFLIVDLNGTAGYQAGADQVIDLTSALHLAQLSTGDFI